MKTELCIFKDDNFERENNVQLLSKNTEIFNGNQLRIEIFNNNNFSIILRAFTKVGFADLPKNVNVRKCILENDDEFTCEKLVNLHTKNGNLNQTEELCISTILKNNFDVFSKNKMDVGQYTDVQHCISTNVKGPITIPPRRIPIALEETVEEHIRDLLTKGIIRESQSSWNSPLVIVPKPDGKIRMCVDFRKLNEITNRPVFSIPDSTSLFDQLGGCHYFSTIDLSQGYYQIEMHPDDIEKTAFTTKSGHYEFLRMPFGLSGAPSTFQRTMTKIFSKFNWRQCVIYLDDVLIFSNTLEEHKTTLQEIFNTIKSANIKLSPKKCTFLKHQVKYLGHVISENGIQTDPDKIDKIKNLPLPKTEDQLVSFLGFCGYYRKFVEKYAEIVAPLENICNKKTKNKEIIWNDVSNKAFEVLKEKMTTPPVLTIPTQNDHFILDTDASDVATGAVLSQIQNGKERVIAYASHKLNKHERRYCTTRKELLAVHKYTLHFKTYLWGQKFTVRTDHRALTWFLSWKNPNTAQYWHWREDLEKFDINIQFRLGDKHKNADFLSRLECGQCDINHEDPKLKSNVKHYKEEANLRAIACQNNFCRDQMKDISIKCVLNLMKSGKINETHPSQLDQTSEYSIKLWQLRKFLRIRGDCLYFVTNNSLYLLIVPEKEIKNLIRQTHQSICHLGIDKTEKLLKEQYFWPNMRFTIKEVIRECKNCAFYKNNEVGKTELKPIVTKFPFQKLGIDVAGPLPTSIDGFRYVLCVIDYFSKFCVLIPLKEINTEAITYEFFSRWISIFGCPYELHSDNATYFTSSVMKELCCKFGITQTFSAPFHPNGNGLVERLIQTIKTSLWSELHKNSKTQWAKILPNFEFAIRRTENCTTGFSSFGLPMNYREWKTGQLGKYYKPP